MLVVAASAATTKSIVIATPAAATAVVVAVVGVVDKMKLLPPMIRGQISYILLVDYSGRLTSRQAKQ